MWMGLFKRCLRDARSVRVHIFCVNTEFITGYVVQHRALVTYVKRVYYPFLVREPELGSAGGNLCAFWLHAPPADCGPEASGSIVLGLALVLPSLEGLAPALAAAERVIADSGECRAHLAVR